MKVLEVQAISKKFGAKQVLDQLTFSIAPGTIFGFVGANGAGKTTTMKMILGLEKIDTGAIYLNGQKVSYGDTATNQMVGYLPDVPAFYDYMTVREYLKLCAQITKIPKEKQDQQIEEMLELVGLSQEKKKIKGFSRGMKQRLGIAQALLNKPQFLICDEPTSALDPSGRTEFLDLLASLKGQVTILFSTHILSDVERIADEVGILHKGRLQVCGQSNALKEQYAQAKIALTFTNQVQATQFSEGWTLSEVTQKREQVAVSYHTSYDQAFQAVLTFLQQQKLNPIAINHLAPSLEQIYLEVTK